MCMKVACRHSFSFDWYGMFIAEGSELSSSNHSQLQHHE